MAVNTEVIFFVCVRCYHVVFYVQVPIVKGIGFVVYAGWVNLT